MLFRSSKIKVYPMSSEWESFGIHRVFLPIDTSSIPDNATITSATLYLYYAGDSSDGDNDGNTEFFMDGVRQEYNGNPYRASTPDPGYIPIDGNISMTLYHGGFNFMVFMDNQYEWTANWAPGEKHYIYLDVVVVSTDYIGTDYDI